MECQACGLLFDRFAQVQDRKRHEVAQPPTFLPSVAGSGPVARIASTLLLVVATAGLTYFLMSGRPSSTTPPVPPPAASVAATQDTPPPPTVASGPSPSSAGTASVKVAVGSPIEEARQGTVSIETRWGQGSGFFVGETTVVTNRHVIEPDRKQLEEIRRKVETGRTLISLEQEKVAEIRRRLSQMQDGPGRRQLVLILQEREKVLAEVLPRQQEVEAKLKDMERATASSEVKVIMADGSEQIAQYPQLSAKRDLALLTVYPAKPVVLKPAPKNSVLQQGDRVFTIGNPVGLRNTVTAGVFSGYRQHQDSGEVMLQTDAPINPGNSGGPLIDERGRVHGINTMVLQHTQGIGFAVPIQAVFEEFSLPVPQ